MAQMNQYEALQGVRSGSGVVSGLTMSLASAVSLTVAAGQLKARMNDETAAQRLNEGGQVLDVSAPAATAASALGFGQNFAYITLAGALAWNTPGTNSNIDQGLRMGNSLTTFQMNSGNTCIGAVEVFAASGTVTIAGTPAAGGINTLTVKSGNRQASVSYTTQAGDTAALVAAGLEAAAAASAAFTALAATSVAGAVITVTPVASTFNPTIEASSTTAAQTQAVAYTKNFRNIDYSRRESIA